MFFPKCESRVSNPHEIAVEIVDLHILLSFMFLDNEREDKNSGENGSRHFSRREYTTCLLDETLYQLEHIAGSFILRFRERQYKRFRMLPWQFFRLSKRMDELMDLRT
jgi:hypothetical protein